MRPGRKTAASKALLEEGLLKEPTQTTRVTIEKPGSAISGISDMPIRLLHPRESCETWA